MSILNWLKRMGRPSTTVPKKKIVTLGQRLEEMARNPQKVSLRDLVYELLPKIKEVQNAGYTLEEIAKAFSDEEVAISASSLKLYLKESQSKNETVKPQSKAATLTEVEPTKVEPSVQTTPQSQPVLAEPEIESQVEQIPVDEEKGKKYKDSSEVKEQFQLRGRQK